MSLFAQLDDEVRPIAEAVHALLLEIEPGFAVDRAWGGVRYKRGEESSCLVWHGPGHIKLMIWRGVELDDPDHVLEGSGTNTRHLRLDALEDLRPAVVRRLLAQQHALFDGGLTAERPAKARPERAPPAWMKTALAARGVEAAFRARPPYQRTGYVSWVSDAQREETVQRRLGQMLAELECGGVYMNMPWG